MRIHASEAFATRFRCDVSLSGEIVEQEGHLDDWSAHYLDVGGEALAFLMNDACLYSLLIPCRELDDFADFLGTFLPRVAAAWNEHGGRFDPANQEVVVLARSHRPLVAVMNDALRLVQLHARDCREDGTPLQLAEMESLLNQTPFEMIEFTPLRAQRSRG